MNASKSFTPLLFIISSIVLVCVGLPGAAHSMEYTNVAKSETKAKHPAQAVPHDWYGRQWHRIIRQTEDKSCGAAVLATVLNYEIGTQATETEILTWVRDKRITDHAGISPHRGLSLDEIIAYLLHRGYAAKAYRVKKEYLSGLNPPAILLIKRWERAHYVLLREIDEQNAWVADPASGNRRIPLKKLQAEWSGYLIGFASSAASNQN